MAQPPFPRVMVLQGVVKGGGQVGAAHTEQVEPHAEYRPRVLCPVAFHQEESPDNDRHRDAYAVRQAVDRFFASAVEETVHAEYRPRVLCPVAFHQEESPDNDRHRDAYAVRQAVDRFFASAVEETVPFSFVSGTHRFICGIKAGGIYKQGNKWHVFFQARITRISQITQVSRITQISQKQKQKKSSKSVNSV